MPQYREPEEWIPEIEEWTPEPQLNIPPINVLDIEREKQEAKRKYILDQRKKLGYGRQDEQIFDYDKFAEGINRHVNTFTNKASYLPEGMREPVAQWGSLAGSGLDLIGAVLADPTTAATSATLSRSLMHDPRGAATPVPMLPKSSAGNAYAPPTPLMRLPNRGRPGNLNPLPSNSYLSGEAGVVPQRKIGTFEPDLLAREGADILTPEDLASQGPIGRDYLNAGGVFNTAEAAEARRLAGLRYTDYEQYPGTRFKIPEADVPPRFESGDTGLGFNPQSDAGAIRQGDITNMETGEITTGNVSASPPLPYPLNIVPNRLRPRAAQENIGRLKPLGAEEAAKGPGLLKSLIKEEEGSLDINRMREIIESGGQQAYDLLRKFFKDDAGTMSFDEMRRRFLVIASKGRGELGSVEQKGIANFGPSIKSSGIVKPDPLTGQERGMIQDLADRYGSQGELPPALNKPGEPSIVLPPKPSLLNRFITEDEGSLDLSKYGLAPKTDEFGRVANQSPNQVPPTGTTPTNAAEATPTTPPKPIPENPLPNLPLPNEKIDPILRPYDAILTWARGQNAAKVRGLQAMELFDDMMDPEDIAKFQSGNRQGRLEDVQKFLDNLFEKEKQAGLFEDSSYRDNYLRQYWDMEKSSEEAVKAFENRTISDKGAFTRDRTFDTYKQGIEAGMVPKFNTIAEIIGARTEESARALYNRELYNYLKNNDWLKSRINTKGEEIFGRIGAPAEWSIIGPHKDDITKYLNNYLTKATKGSQLMADMAAFAKNIYLSGGIPKTKYNIHAWNVARADAKIMGYGKGISEIFKDPTGNAAAKWFAELKPEQKQLLPELMEHGYIFHPLEDVGSTGRMGTSSGALFGKRVEGVSGAHPFLERLPETGKLGKLRKIGIKATETVQDWFESPLFNKALPALKFKRAMDIFDGLKDKMPRDAALDAAARIANEYHGGIEKALRSKTEQNYMKFILIAPDWAEAKIRQAINEYAAFAGKRYQTSGGMGRFTDISPAEATLKKKAFGRGLGITAAGAVGSELYYGDQGENQSEFAGIPLPGSELILPEGAHIPTMGTFDESVRPLTILNEMAKGYTGQALVTEFGNRLNPIPRSMVNLGTNRNVFGGQLWGPNVPASKQAGNIFGEVTRPVQHASAVAVWQFLNSGMSWDDAVKAASTATESPIKFRKKER